MTAFARAMAVLLRDPNMSQAAEYVAAPGEPPLAVRVLRSQPDVVAGGFDLAAIRATDVLSVARADFPAPPVAGAVFRLAGLDLRVQQARLDATGTAWSVPCERA